MSPIQYKIVIPESLPIKEVWPSEPVDFTPWLSENLALLDLIGLGRLTLEDIEVKIPQADRYLDLLAMTPDGMRVAIENQYSRSDHDHFTRGLAYAVGLECSALVVIAESFGGEFIAVADYLNSVGQTSTAERKIRVFLVEVGAERIEDFAIPRLSLRIGPNGWLEEAADTAPKSFLNLESFLDLVPEFARSTFAETISYWQSIKGFSIRFSRQSVSLDLPRPSNQRKPLSHLLLWTDGSFTVQRGYLLDAGVGGSPEVVDAAIRNAFPKIIPTPKNYFLSAKLGEMPLSKQVEVFIKRLYPDLVQPG